MIYTSNFGSVQNLLAAHIVPVGIARGIPRGYKGFSYRKLAPTWAMLKMARAEYEQRYEKILAELNPLHVVTELHAFGPDIALLCWEAPCGPACHRRTVAEWLEQSLGLIIPEWGFSRSETPAYVDMPQKH